MYKRQRLDSSFKTVSEQLEKLYKSLGEMKELSNGVTSNVTTLNRVLTGNWKCHKENTVDWNDQKYAEVWRHSWETITNRYLEAAGSLPIGGLREKAMAAYRNGIRMVLIPKENEPSLYEVDEQVKKKIIFSPQEEVTGILRAALRWLRHSAKKNRTR